MHCTFTMPTGFAAFDAMALNEENKPFIENQKILAEGKLSKLVKIRLTKIVSRFE